MLSAKGGAVVCRGRNVSGELGDGTYTSSSVPVQVVGLASATAIGAGASGGCALRQGGNVVCWGVNDLYGYLGNGTTVANRNIPVTMSGVTDAVALNVGNGDSCVIRQGGSAACWGLELRGPVGSRPTRSVQHGAVSMEHRAHPGQRNHGCRRDYDGWKRKASGCSGWGSFSDGWPGCLCILRRLLPPTTPCTSRTSLRTIELPNRRAAESGESSSRISSPSR